MAGTDQWRWTDSKGVQRLLSADELRAALADGRLPADILVWRRGMPKWCPASEVAELEDAIDEDGPPTITREHEMPVGKKTAPTPSIPPTDLSLSALRGLGPKPKGLKPTGPKPTGPKPTDSGSKPRDPKPLARPPSRAHAATEGRPAKRAGRPGAGSRPDGGWKDGAARRDEPEQTVTELREDEEPGTIARPPHADVSRPHGKRPPRTPSSSAEPAPSAKQASAPPPPPRRSTAPPPARPRMRSVPAPRRASSSPSPSVPPPVGSSEVLSSAFDAPSSYRDPSAVSPGAPRPSFGSHLPSSPGSSAAAAMNAREEQRREAGGGAEFPLAGQVPVPASNQVVPTPAPSDSGLELIPGTTIGTVDGRASHLPAPRPGRGFRVERRIAAIAGMATLAVMLFAFVLGRVTAPEVQASLGPAIEARTGFAVVPLFARSRMGPTVAPRPCLMARAPSRLRGGASKSVPFETLALDGGRLAVGYARTSATPRGIIVDPATGAVEVAYAPADPLDEDLSRVVPAVATGADVDFRTTLMNEGDLIEPIVVPGAAPFSLGFRDGALVRATDGGEGADLWSLGEGAVERMALTARRDDRRTVVAYRHGATIFVGSLDAEGAVEVGATAVAGSGGKVGKPSVAVNGGAYGVVFADKPQGDAAPIEVRWARGAVGSPLGDAEVVALPPGGPGGNAIAPSLAALPGGRWLLMWTEGPRGGQTLRAQTYDAKYTPIGEALRVSPATGSFGQGMAAVIDQRAVVLFLLATPGSYELWGTVLQCQ